MSDQLKLSKLFYINPTSPGLPTPPPSLAHLSTVKKDILRDGFDSKHPIIIRLDGDKRIADGNHRLAIALELKLDYVPVRFRLRYLKEIPLKSILSNPWQIKLSEIFYVNPIRTCSEHIQHNFDKCEIWNRYDKHTWKQNRWDTLKSEISKKGFDDKYPILIHLDYEDERIIDGNHRLAIALELKLDYVPVRFEHMIRN